ncbi:MULTISPECIES: hypothetical protein [Acinetobacter]|uniref:hypothetical protein n=1 Tax=Acinetobacter TaxID=469 RepID=UPI0013D04375|nr:MULTISPECIES: hypothetical protein [Acinetobacter]
MVVGNLPQPSEAGYSMFSMGVATYKRYVFKIAATTTSRNDTGGAASIGMQWK